MISCLIMTKDEEDNLPCCLEKLKWCDDIVVLDSGSTDGTVEIARSFGARVYHRDWDDERQQRTYSLAIPYKHPWVFNPDADEVTPTALSEEINQVVRDPSLRHNAYRVRFKVMFMGKWVRRSSLYPTWVVRLFRPDCVSFERNTNLQYIVRGTTGRLKEHFEHHTFRRGLHHWYQKHNEYSTLEAREALKLIRTGSIDYGHLTSFDPVIRRRAWKELSLQIPFRALATLFYILVIRRGFLDGPAGWAYAALRGSYELMIELKLRELLMKDS